ncbi:MAG: hypothetical protein IJD57_04710 [Candidatus Gastranaerophilales bacterium]|nr:hypothetical protein [Candidatus Gastranaerophilales bacterium]
MNRKSVVFLILFCVSFFVSLFVFKDKIDVPYFNGLNKKICYDIFYNDENALVFKPNPNFTVTKIDKNHYYFEQNDFSRKTSLNFSSDEIKNIKKLTIYNGFEPIFVKDLKTNYNFDNSKPLLDRIAIIFLSFFYNFQFYLLSYIFLLLFLNSQEIKIKKPLLFFIGLGLFLRITQINSIPFWDDEIYVLSVTAQSSPLSALFEDFGNPPLFFIFFKIYSSIVSNPEFYRYFGVFLGLILNILIYVFLKNNFGKKQATLALFISTINIILIYYSQEIRSYMLLMLLNVLCAICLFKFRKKTAFQYFFSTFALILTHYYGAFIFFFNFVFGLVFFCKNKIKLKMFLISNLILMCFLAILINSKLKGITSNFNSWLSEPKIEDFILAIKIFCPILIFALFVAFLAYIYSKTEKKLQKIFLTYNFALILSVFLMAFLFSILIKPIFYYKYFYSIFPNFLILCAIAIAFNYKTKFKSILQIVLFVAFLTMQRVNYQNLYCNHNLYLDFIKNDIDVNKTNYVFMTDTVEKYHKFNIQGAKMVYLPVNIGINEINLAKFDDKPFVAYVLNLYLNDDTIKKAQNIELYKTPLGVFTKAEFK